MKEKKNDFNAREIESISLLDKRTLEAHKDILPDINEPYWLQGGLCIIPVKKLDNSIVYGTSFGTDLDTQAGVRPIIEFHDPNRFIFKHRGDVLNFEGKEWMIVSKNEAICNDFIGNCAYQRTPKLLSAEDKYRYDLSDIKGYTENWLNDLKLKEKNEVEKEPEPEYEEIGER